MQLGIQQTTILVGYVFITIFVITIAMRFVSDQSCPRGGALINSGTYFIKS
jgi:hypothetical protein